MLLSHFPGSKPAKVAGGSREIRLLSTAGSRENVPAPISVRLSMQTMFDPYEVCSEGKGRYIDVRCLRSENRWTVQLSDVLRCRSWPDFHEVWHQQPVSGLTLSSLNRGAKGKIRSPVRPLCEYPGSWIYIAQAILQRASSMVVLEESTICTACMLHKEKRQELKGRQTSPTRQFSFLA